MNDLSERSGDPTVLIVGAGPSGLTLALDLAWRGVPSVVIESAPERPTNPRCNTTSARSMEIFRRLGLSDEIRRAGLPRDHPTSVNYRTTLTGEEIFRLDLPSAADVLGGVGRENWLTPEPQHRISQLYLEPILDEAVSRNPLISYRPGTSLTGVTQDADGVTVDLSVDGVLEQERYSYVVGCDGAHSTVRKLLGIAYQGVSALQNFVSSLVRSTELGEIASEHPAWTYWTFADRPAALLAINGSDLWLSHVAFSPDHDTALERPSELVERSVGRPFAHEIVSVVRWTGRQLVAERYGEDRVFLAGDAAHVWIPVGGFGMNAGIQDAASLSWMLAAVIHGWAPAELLREYETERRPVGEQFARSVGAAAKSAFADFQSEIHDAGESGEQAREEFAGRLATTEPQRYTPNGFSFGYHYVGSPLIVSTGEEPEIGMVLHETHARVGFRLPHFWMPDGRSVFDALAPEFTLIRTEPAADVNDWVREAQDRKIPLKILELEHARGHEHIPAALALVRPDQHVAWMGSAIGRPGDVLDQVTGRALAIA